MCNPPLPMGIRVVVDGEMIAFVSLETLKHTARQVQALEDANGVPKTGLGAEKIRC